MDISNLAKDQNPLMSKNKIKESLINTINIRSWRRMIFQWDRRLIIAIKACKAKCSHLKWTLRQMSLCIFKILDMTCLSSKICKNKMTQSLSSKTTIGLSMIPTEWLKETSEMVSTQMIETKSTKSKEINNRSYLSKVLAAMEASVASKEMKRK